MSGRKVLGTSSIEVLLLLTRDGLNRSWDTRTGRILYENRGMSEEVCRRLAQNDYLVASHEDGNTVYSVTAAGTRKAEELRRSR